MPATTSIPSSTVTPLFGTPAEASLHWLDAQAQWAEIWMECQRGIWQPVFDLQVGWMLQWLDQLGAPVVGAFAIRGQEQLG